MRELASRASQAVSGASTTDDVQPVALKYCVEQEYLESLLDLGFIEGAKTYDDVSTTVLRTYLKSQAQFSKNKLNIAGLDQMVKSELRTDMKDEDAVSSVRNLFVNCHKFLRKPGVPWVIHDNPKLAVRPITTAIYPETLRMRLHSDLSFR